MVCIFITPNLFISLDVPAAPRALIVAATSPNSVLASWVPALNMPTDPLLPAGYHEVTLSDLRTGLTLRRSNISSIEGAHRQRQLFDNLSPRTYQIAVVAGNVFGRSRSLSLNFDITGKRQCSLIYCNIIMCIVCVPIHRMCVVHYIVSFSDHFCLPF